MANESKIDDAVKACVFGQGDKLFPVLMDVVRDWKQQFLKLTDEDEKAFVQALCLKLANKCIDLYNQEDDEIDDDDDDDDDDDND